MTNDGPGRLGGSVMLGGRRVRRIGYGAMQLEHLDRAGATQLLRRAIELGVDHIDTASFYGDATVNEYIRAALHPYPDDLVIVSKVGARIDDARTSDGRIPLAAAQRPEELREQVHLDLQTLGLEQVPVVNVRRLDRPPGILAEGDQVVPLDDQLAELIAMRDDGLVGAIGLSNVNADQVRQAMPAGIACVQNSHNLLDRSGEDVLALCARNDIAWVPYMPLGSAFERIPSPADDPLVQAVAAEAEASATVVALAWLLAHDPHVALIPGTRSVEHLEENLAAGSLRLTPAQLARLDALGSVVPS